MALVLFSFKILGKMLLTLNESREGINRTKLACICGLNYDTCIKYVELLAKLRWVSGVSERGGLVFINEVGREYARMLSEGGDNLDSKTWFGSDINLADSPKGFDFRQTSQLTKEFDVGTIARHKDPLSKARILIVDDEPDVLVTYKLHLTELGFDVHAFSNSVEAFRKFTKDPLQYYLALLDIRMDSLNGLQLYRKFKSMNPDLKVIFLTGLDAAPELVSLLPGLSKEDIFAKPVDLDKLAATVRVVTSEHRNQKTGSASD